MATTNKGFENKQYGKSNNKNERKKNQRKQTPIISPTASKQKPYFVKKPVDKYGDPFEYKMSLAGATDILKECPAKTRPEQFLCDFVNEQYGLLGWCCRVVIEG